jgi:glycosyltransferase involved in cell wall biosynthesis
MKKEPLLSICIPTFQRKESLKRTLDKLIEVEKFCLNKIEICVSDNGSSDGTFEMLEDYRKKYPFINIRRNKKNLGFDLNLVASFKMAYGKYCWGIGDDDTPIIEGIKKLIILLENKNVSACLTGAVAYKRDWVIINEDFKKQEYNTKEFIKVLIQIIKQYNRFLKIHQDITILGFLPCYCFNRETLKHAFREIKVKKSGWYHLTLLFYVLSNLNGSIIVNKSISLTHGQKQEHKKDDVLLPEGAVTLFMNQRIEALENLEINKELANYFYRWLNSRGIYFYIKSLGELLFFSDKISHAKYECMKNKIYQNESQLNIPRGISIFIEKYKKMESSLLFRKFINLIYTWINRKYSKQIREYLQGKLNTHEGREGRAPYLKDKN